MENTSRDGNGECYRRFFGFGAKPLARAGQLGEDGIQTGEYRLELDVGLGRARLFARGKALLAGRVDARFDFLCRYAWLRRRGRSGFATLVRMGL
jgi:hypothetical protein